MNRRLLALLAVPVALAIPAGVAHANSFTADANCDGLAFSMARGEAGTVVEALIDGRRVAIGTVATHGDPIAFTVPNPDPTATHTYVVTIDSRFNTDQTWSETVGPCVTATTVPAATTTTTVVAVTTPPVPSSTPTTTVPVPGRPVVAATTTTVPVAGPYRLPDTGAGQVLIGMTLLAAAFAVVGTLAVRWNKR